MAGGVILTSKEDALLISLKSQGKAWKSIAKNFPGRSMGACRGHYHTIFGESESEAEMTEEEEIEANHEEARPRRSTKSLNYFESPPTSPPNPSPQLLPSMKKAEKKGKKRSRPAKEAGTSLYLLCCYSRAICHLREEFNEEANRSTSIERHGGQGEGGGRCSTCICDQGKVSAVSDMLPLYADTI